METVQGLGYRYLFDSWLKCGGPLINLGGGMFWNFIFSNFESDSRHAAFFFLIPLALQLMGHGHVFFFCFFCSHHVTHVHGRRRRLAIRGNAAFLLGKFRASAAEDLKSVRVCTTYPPGNWEQDIYIWGYFICTDMRTKLTYSHTLASSYLLLLINNNSILSIAI